MKRPLDSTPYPKDPRSRPIGPSLADGPYVYVQDLSGVVHVLPDGPHTHPKVLGGGQHARYAGDMTVWNGRVCDLRNLSGTFQCDDPEGLLAVADEIILQGLLIAPNAVRFFPPDGSRPQILR